MSTAAATDKQVAYLDSILNRLTATGDADLFARAASYRAVDAGQVVYADGGAARVYRGALAAWVRDNLGRDAAAELGDTTLAWVAVPFGRWVLAARPDAKDALIATLTGQGTDGTVAALWSEWLALFASLLDGTHSYDREQASTLINTLK